jgi:type II secretory pathway predicted ATPase ExeA
MYEEFYGLVEKPFTIQPDPSFLYWGRGHRLAYAMLEYGVVNQAGISVITGEVGCGKTTLIHRLLEQLSDTHTVALLSNIQSGRGELLSWVLMGFGEPYAGKSHVEMFAQLQQFFIREYARGKRVVLIIDEAQNLSVDMLEELRMLSNINAGKDQLLQLILVGQPQLKDLLSRPDMLQLAQRIGSDFHLTPLSREEVHAYIETRLTIAGAQKRIFSDSAMDLVAEQSRGVPRVINIIADTALVYAFSAQAETVSEETIRNVIRDKLDYGVFGLASSPDVKLTEWREPRSSGFLREVPKEREPDPVNRTHAAEQSVEISSHSVGIRLVAQEASDRRIVQSAEYQIGGPSLYARPESAAVAFPAATPVEYAVPERSLGPTPRAEEATREIPKKAENAGAELSVGVVVIASETAGKTPAISAPPSVACVLVAPSGEAARAASPEGAEIVEIQDTTGGGRARNAGYRRLKKLKPDLSYVQFLDAGVSLDPAWLAYATTFMARRPEVAALEGVIEPSGVETSLLGSLAWLRHGPQNGEIQATGPNVLFRADAFEAAGGFRGDILADATTDLCVRLRRRGAHVWRSETRMAEVEPKKPTFGQWRRDRIEAGYAAAAGAALHGGPPERLGVTEQARAALWGAFLPSAIILAMIIAAAVAGAIDAGINPMIAALAVFGAGLSAYVLKSLIAGASVGRRSPSALSYGFWMTFGHIFEAIGVAQYWFSGGKDRQRKA